MLKTTMDMTVFQSSDWILNKAPNYCDFWKFKKMGSTCCCGDECCWNKCSTQKKIHESEESNNCLVDMVDGRQKSQWVYDADENAYTTQFLKRQGGTNENFLKAQY